MQRIGIISAPMSKQNVRRPTLWIDLEKLISNHGLLFVTQTLKELDEALLEFQRCGVSIIAINGGDGTISRVITRAVKIFPVENLPSFIPLRGGNFNILASNLGIKTGPRTMLSTLLDMLKEGHPLRQLTLRTLDIDDQLGFLFVNGSGCRFLEEFYRVKKGDTLDSVLHLARIALSKHRDPDLYHRIVHNVDTKIWVDGRLRFVDVSAGIFCSTMPKMPWGLNIFPRAEAAKGFEVVVYHNPPESTVTKGIIDTFIRPHRSPYRTAFCGKSLKMELSEPSVYTLDGELFYPKSGVQHFKLGPELPFILP